MERVTGIGGIFFKAKDAGKLRDWYRDNLGLEVNGDSGAMFFWREMDDPEQTGLTIWSAFPSDTKYFEPSASPFMVNYRVSNLDGILEQLRAAGARIDDRIEEHEYGRFAWATDPEGNRFELWEPPANET